VNPLLASGGERLPLAEPAELRAPRELPGRLAASGRAKPGLGRGSAA